MDVNVRTHNYLEYIFCKYFTSFYFVYFTINTALVSIHRNGDRCVLIKMLC